VVKLVYTLASGASGSNAMEVQVLSSARNYTVDGSNATEVHPVIPVIRRDASDGVPYRMIGQVLSSAQLNFVLNGKTLNYSSKYLLMKFDHFLL
jgi:hypothetical protein